MCLLVAIRLFQIVSTNKTAAFMQSSRRCCLLGFIKPHIPHCVRSNGEAYDSIILIADEIHYMAA